MGKNAAGYGRRLNIVNVEHIERQEYGGLSFVVTSRAARTRSTERYTLVLDRWELTRIVNAALASVREYAAGAESFRSQVQADVAREIARKAP